MRHWRRWNISLTKALPVGCGQVLDFQKVVEKFLESDKKKVSLSNVNFVQGR